MVRKARQEDYQNISELRESRVIDRDRLESSSYLAAIQEEGFVIRTYSKAKFLTHFNNIFCFEDETGNIRGFIRLKYKRDPRFEREQLNLWMNNKFKDIYFEKGMHAEVRDCVVTKVDSHGTVLSDILDFIVSKLKSKEYKYLFANYTFAPFINTPLMILYDKEGYEKICLTTASEMHGIKDYQAILCVKAI